MFNDITTFVNNNKNIIILVFCLFVISYIDFKLTTNKIINLFDNNIFKLIVFMVISFIGISNKAIGICLALILLISMQVITSIKIKNEFENELNEQLNILCDDKNEPSNDIILTHLDILDIDYNN